MAGNLLDLANRMEALKKRLPAAASDTAVKVAETIVADLAFHTPVDTSQALSNWIVTLDGKNVGRIDPHFYGERGSTQKASAAQTIAQARQVLKNKKPGQTIYITNNLPYIRRLNEGYSGQAPAGFVERSVLIARKLVKKLKLKLR
jgi:hypothetical protein